MAGQKNLFDPETALNKIATQRSCDSRTQPVAKNSDSVHRSRVLVDVGAGEEGELAHPHRLHDDDGDGREEGDGGDGGGGDGVSEVEPAGPGGGVDGVLEEGDPRGVQERDGPAEDEELLAVEDAVLDDHRRRNSVRLQGFQDEEEEVDEGEVLEGDRGQLAGDLKPPIRVEEDWTRGGANVDVHAIPHEEDEQMREQQSQLLVGVNEPLDGIVSGVALSVSSLLSEGQRLTGQR